MWSTYRNDEDEDSILDVQDRRKYRRLPCKKCITLPICIIKFKEFTNQFESSTILLQAYEFPRDPNSRCSLLIDYFNSESHDQVYNVYRLKTFSCFIYKHINK
jgi:hypothetical protein